MPDYLMLKWLHIVSSVVLVGTGLGSAFHLFFANRQPSLVARAVAARLVVRADRWFTTPAVLIQPISGWALATQAGWPLDTPWLMVSIVLFLVAGACWLPVLWLQVQMQQLAEAALQHGHVLPPRYRAYQRAWEGLGCPAFLAMLAVFYLMVVKPALWAG
jgi:uncharacterized membrane protein